MSLITELPRIIKQSQKKYDSLYGKPFYISEEIGGIGAREMDCHSESLGEAENILCHGENGLFMKSLIEAQGMAGKIKLIYIDPPFFSKANYDAVIKVGEESIKHFAYEDIWQKGVGEYLKMLTVRFMLMRDLLADDGTAWVHLDWHVVHYAKVILDEIFGENNFVNEIIWTYKSGGTGKRSFSKKHDTILVYSKTPKYYFKPLQEKSYNREFKPYRFKGVKEYRDEVGWYTMVNMKDVWQIDMVGRTSSERTGYATQKPEALMERIIESCTKEGDLCADFFCGSGTFPAVCAKMGRRWIASDSGTLAIESTIKRLGSTCGLRTSVGINGGSGFKVVTFESEDNEALRGGGNAKIKVSIDDADMTSMKHITVGITGYKPRNLAKIVDEKSLDTIKEVMKNNSCDLIESWSVDFNYDGRVHRPEQFFVREKSRMILSCEKLIREYNIISVKTVDVFGNRTFNVINLNR